MSILDDYFDGYYSEEMIESQVKKNSTLVLLKFLFDYTFPIFELDVGTEMNK